ncbi:hypothetical protein N473_17685 [Pseudoalteromonas luteoviolacea CPMOR-1]|uniref:RNA 2',3'-cyclic phosphodiesterase n=1 Tax=Pseudoalteromonas luteoviolacea CPMOR-1 TaxID=1365248 RepID=A0A167KTW2_9GAMM|nr:RNA 2',3'-cyclic phosphodiesterase [Pseudoalteromonas luteoviolacea]KZN63260.1 hypothetical protein N473_17685 [Pseudoalteromonas luteoviolacea CPMOR-1]
MSGKRLFFGIGLEARQRAHIESWLTLHVTAKKAPTLSRNWHMTLAFLAQVDSEREDTLIRWARELVLPPFQLRFAESGYWSNNGIFYLQPDHINRSLGSLADPLREYGEQLGLYRNPYPFSPHITLFRGVKPVPHVDVPIEPFSLDVTHFHLYQSHTLDDGLHYTPIETFALSA